MARISNISNAKILVSNDVDEIPLLHSVNQDQNDLHLPMESIVKIMQDDHITNPKQSDLRQEVLVKQLHSGNQDQNDDQLEASGNQDQNDLHDLMGNHVLTLHDQNEDDHEVRKNEAQLVDEIGGEVKSRDVAFNHVHK
jgi:hypothetical protein